MLFFVCLSWRSLSFGNECSGGSAKSRVARVCRKETGDMKDRPDSGGAFFQ